MDSTFEMRFDEPLRFPCTLSSYEVDLLLDSSVNVAVENNGLERSILELVQKDEFEKLFSIVPNYGLNDSDDLEPGSALTSTQAHEILGAVKGYLQYFIRLNYTGPSIGEICQTPNEVHFDDLVAREKWTLDGEGIIDNVKRLSMIYLAERMLSVKTLSEFCPSSLWWTIRVYFLHQNCLEEKSAILWNATKKCVEAFQRFLENPVTIISPELVALYYIELSQIYSYYYDTENSKRCVSKAKGLMNIVARATGVMGKRTRYQQTELAQLVLQVELTGESSGCAAQLDSMDSSDLPQAVVLEDEDRLDKLNITDAVDIEKRLTASDINEIQHLLILAEFDMKRKYLPHDGIYREELSAYLNFLIDKPKVWSVQLMALLHRSILELDSRRTVERSMAQLEVLRKVVEEKGVSSSRQRVKYFYGSGMCMKWEIEVALCQVLSSLNLHKEALDISLRLERWENVISCYSNLNLRHKAEEVIREQLKKAETVKLWILLGDATDSVEYYEKAWLLSNKRSARAQRQWGFYYFARKDYAAALPHLQTSVELNPLENPAWIRLGFAALSTESWKVSTRAYQHSSTLDADNFEVWNNLGHGFIKLGEKPRALRALKEASKCNYESWKVWDNLMVVATDCKAFDDVIRSYNRLLDLKEKWSDDQVLALLVKAIVTNVKDSSDQPSQKYLKDALKLFGRTTAVITNNPRIWKLYSDLVLVQAEVQATSDSSVSQDLWTKSVGYSQRSVESILSDPNWSKVDVKIEEAVDFAQEYMQRVSEFIQLYSDASIHSDALTKAHFTVKRIYAGVKKTKDSAIDAEKYEKCLVELRETAQLVKMENF